MRARAEKKPRPPLDAEALERLGLFYAGRYATTRARLRAYLLRKLKERGWGGGGDPDVERLVERFSQLGYVDDRSFATARAASLGRRGYGERRIVQALHAAGIEEEDARPAREEAGAAAWQSALRFAERKRIGPWATERPDRAGREKAFAALMRAGHPSAIARKLVSSAPGDIPEPDTP